MSNKGKKNVPNYEKLGLTTFYKDIKYGLGIFRAVLEKEEKLFKNIDIDKSILSDINIDESESYSLGFGKDEDISLDEILYNCINIKNKNVLDKIKSLIINVEKNKLLDFTTFSLPENPNTVPYIVYSNKENIILGVGFLKIDTASETVTYNTFIFYDYKNPLKSVQNNKLFDLNKIMKHFDVERFNNSALKDKDFEGEFLPNELYALNRNDKLFFISNFIESEIYTNVHDRTFLEIISGNLEILNKIIFVKQGLFVDNIVYYSSFDAKNDDSKCAFKIRCDKRRDDIMDSLPRMDALEYILEHYDTIFVKLPIPEKLNMFMDGKLLKNFNIDENENK